MRPSSDTINIAARTQRLDVDNRISLRYYYRIADNILKQADIFRAEKNIIDLYVMLMRFSSLVNETIPCHRDYGASHQSKKTYLRKKLLDALSELEELKPAVLQKVDELNRKQAYQGKGWDNHQPNDSLEWPLVRKQNNYSITKTAKPVAREALYQGSWAQQFSYTRPVEDQLRKLSLNILRPKEETLSRHSILGPNGLYGQWKPPVVDKGVKYPCIMDLTPVEIPSLPQSVGNKNTTEADHSNSEQKRSNPEMESILTLNDSSQTHSAENPSFLISFDPIETTAPTENFRELSPPPVLAEVLDLVPAASPLVSEAKHTVETPSPGFSHTEAEAPLELHLSTTLMESFMRLAKSNTDKNLETCGILAGSLKNRKFNVTALIIPKQESTSDSCQATNEEEIFEVQDKQSLFPLGWIHTHPSQSCFMSSVDLHTHYSYQIMLPEAVAIVMAPKDSSRTHGIFRLTTPGGISVIRQCQQRGFHPHSQPPDGGPIYKHCTDVYVNPKLKFDVIDLR